MNILTFDIEEWWVYDNYSIGKNIDYLPRIDNYLNDILDLLDLCNFKATFFCLGLVGLKYAYVIKKIASRGHGIASHSHSHKFLGDLNKNEFHEDTRKSLFILEDIIGKKIDTYRAPAFSITKDKIWAFEILHNLGIKNDCSIFPSNRSFGGFPTFPFNEPTIIRSNYFELREFPIPTVRFFNKNFAFSGGGYFRLIPYFVLTHLLKNNSYNMTYFHIKDFDSEQVHKWSILSTSESSFLRYFKDYYGISNSFNKFKKVLTNFDFIDLNQAISSINWDKAPVFNI